MSLKHLLLLHLNVQKQRQDVAELQQQLQQPPAFASGHLPAQLSNRQPPEWLHHVQQRRQLQHSLPLLAGASLLGGALPSQHIETSTALFLHFFHLVLRFYPLGGRQLLIFSSLATVSSGEALPLPICNALAPFAARHHVSPIDLAAQLPVLQPSPLLLEQQPPEFWLHRRRLAALPSFPLRTLLSPNPWSAHSTHGACRIIELPPHLCWILQR